MPPSRGAKGSPRGARESRREVAVVRRAEAGLLHEASASRGRTVHPPARAPTPLDAPPTIGL